MVTIKDVARLAGVGLGTASRVVSGRGSVAPETARRVRRAIEVLNYRPSHAARALLSGSTQTIGVYIPLLKGTFYTPILHTIDRRLRELNRHMVVSFGHGEVDDRRSAIETIDFLTHRDCDGLVIMSSALGEADIALLARQQSRFVVLNREFEAFADHCFFVDHERGGRLAARALLENGHRCIAVIGGPGSAADNLARLRGFMRELAEAGIDAASVPTVEGDFSPEGGRRGAQELRAAGRPFTALFCANDEMAVGALSYFQQAGIDVPRQISVLGYDDTPSAQFSAPSLTSVHIPLRELTVAGVNHLVNLCYDLELPVERGFQVSVTRRDSLGRAPARPA